MSNDWQLNTKLIHASAGDKPSTAVSSPIYQSATYEFESPEAIAAEYLRASAKFQEPTRFPRIPSRLDEDELTKW